jgi:hypothetical protein
MNGRRINNIKLQSFPRVGMSTLVSAAALFLLAGCPEPQSPEILKQVCLPNAAKLRAMQAAEAVLSEMHFTIDKADAERGLIRTRPLPGAQFFEFWRTDSVGTLSAAEANLHSIRRSVELDITQQREEVCLSCDVKVQRLSLPEHKVSSSSRAYEMFSKSTAAMQRIELRPEQQERMKWVDLGNDTKLATVILKRIEERVSSERTE